MPLRLSRRSENAVAAVLGAVTFAIFATGTAMAAATIVQIQDPVSGKKAGVTAQSSLVTSDRDPVTGAYARNDSGGRRMVGDGTGPLTVDGTLSTRAGGTTNAFNFKQFANSTGFWPVQQAAAPGKIAITEMTFATLGGTGTWDIALVSYVRTSGSAACGGIGWVKTSLRDITIPTSQPMQQIEFNGPPLVLPAPAAGQVVCFGLEVWNLPSSSVIRMGGTGYVFSSS